jgi:hypothetical protein
VFRPSSGRPGRPCRGRERGHSAGASAALLDRAAHIGRPPLECPSCGGPVSTAQTTVNPAHAQPEASGGAQGKTGDDAPIQRAMVASRPCLCSDTPSSARPERPPRPGAPRSSGNAASLRAQPRPVRATAAMAYNGFARKGLTVGARLDNAPDRHDRLAQGCSGQWRLRPAPCWLRARHGPASTASTKASTSRKASHEAREVLAGLKAVPICGGSDGCCDGRRQSLLPSRASAPIHLKVASRKAPAGTPRLRTD